MALLLIVCQESGNKVCMNAAHCQIVYRDLLEKSAADASGVYVLTDCFLMVFVD
jgi:hypothetical protein